MGAGASFAHDLSLEFRFGRKQSFVSSVAGAQVGEAGRSIGNTGVARPWVGETQGWEGRPSTPASAKRDRRCGWAVAEGWKKGRKGRGAGQYKDNQQWWWWALPSPALKWPHPSIPDFPFAAACLARPNRAQSPSCHNHRFGYEAPAHPSIMNEQPATRDLQTFTSPTEAG